MKNTTNINYINASLDSCINHLKNIKKNVHAFEFLNIFIRNSKIQIWKFLIFYLKNDLMRILKDHSHCCRSKVKWHWHKLEKNTELYKTIGPLLRKRKFRISHYFNEFIFFQIENKSVCLSSVNWNKVHMIVSNGKTNITMCYCLLFTHQQTSLETADLLHLKLVQIKPNQSL